MDNRDTLAGYKYYVDEESGERPAIYVAFVNIHPASGGSVNGIAYPVDVSALPLLDERERNYERRDVTGALDADVGGRVWAYVGTPAGRRRYETGRADGTVFVSHEYHESVRHGFARLGAEALEEFDRTTDDVAVPRRALRRIDLPQGGVSASGEISSRAAS